MTKFYILKENDYTEDYKSTGMEWMKGDITNYGDAPQCPQCGKYIGTKEWLPPYRIELEMPVKVFGNVALGGGGPYFIVDDYFKSCFEKTDLTGLEFVGEAIIDKVLCLFGIRKKMLGEPPQYYVARIQSGCAAIDQEKSGFVFELGKAPTCSYCRRGLVMRYSRIVIDESTWDGTDIFLARGIGGMITTSQRFKDWWDSCHFNNCKLIPAEEEHRDHHPGVSPEEYARKS